jgi:hypothetical protein
MVEIGLSGVLHVFARGCREWLLGSSFGFEVTSLQLASGRRDIRDGAVHRPQLSSFDVLYEQVSWVMQVAREHREVQSVA